MSTWIDRFKGKTIRSALEEACRRYASKEAMVFEGERVTFEDLLEKSASVARGFLSLGVQSGDRVAIWMAGYAEWAYLYFALSGIGAVT